MDPLISVSELGDYLGRSLSGDNGGTIAVNAASEACRTMAEQSFTAGTSSIEMDGSGTDALLLPELPVTNIGTVTVNGTAAGTAEYTVNAQGALVLRSGGTLTSPPWSSYDSLRGGAVWPKGRQNVAVTYTHGGTIPDDVRMVALSMASRLIVQGVASYEVVGDASVRYGTNSTDFTAGERAILRKYKVAR